MKIYDYEGFPNPLRVRVALKEKGLFERVTFEKIDVPAGEHRTPEFLQKNPFGAVPVLELDDGTTIAECTAITEFLDHIAGEPVLTGRTPRERALIHMMQRRAEACLLDAVSTYFHHATPGLGPALETYQCSEWGNYQKQRALNGMKYLNGTLSKQSYLVGDEFSMADITAYAGLVFADFAQIEVPENFQALIAWRQRIAARPSVAG